MDLIKPKKNDARRPDIVTAELKKGFDWTTKHTTSVMLAIGVFVVVGGGYAGWKTLNERSEKDLQAKYYEIESQVTAKKEAFEMAKAPPPAAAAKDKKDEKPAVPASGDLAKDYGDLPQKLADFANQHPKTKAGAMAALTYAGLMADYKKSEEALPVLQKVHTSGILSGLVSMQLATLLANTGKCDEATGILEKMLGNPATAFLKLEAKLKIGLCAQQSGNLAKAEQNFLQVIEEGKENSLARSAQKYMRLIQLKRGQEAVKN